ncbi:MAG: hypothetical protein KJO08_05160 [Gammaproteobacteria bacterium]|nr:hypothetical protein [Gammaproteobacteria bacterium]NNJ85432.1 hypothetical protein [Gammaproteobacteria bacterium]
MKKGLRHLFSPFVSVLLVAGIGYTVIGEFYPAPAKNGNSEDEIVTQPRQAHRPHGMKVSTDDPSRALAKLHLFGKIPTQKAHLPPAEEVPETTLKLALHGIIAADGGETSLAIIADARGEQSYYAVGQALPEGATILAVHGDYVVLRHNERLETLRMLDAHTNSTTGRRAAEQFLPVRVEKPRSRRSRNNGRAIGRNRRNKEKGKG